jgi:hypothetical protein
MDMMMAATGRDGDRSAIIRARAHPLAVGYDDDRSAVVSTSLREGWNRSEGSAENQRGEAYGDFEPHVLLFLVDICASSQRGRKRWPAHIVPFIHCNVLGAVLNSDTSV